MLDPSPFLREFPNSQVCFDYLWRRRFAADGEHAGCGQCRLITRFRPDETVVPSSVWRCTRCDTAISVTEGTVLDGSAVSAHAWFTAAYVTAVTRGGATAQDLARMTGLDPDTAGQMHAALLTAREAARPTAVHSTEEHPEPGTIVNGIDLAVLVAAPVAAVSTRRAPRGNLPPSPNRFIGRRNELAQVGTLLTKSRCVTLVGTGGSGKTRLALEAACRHLDAGADDVWWVDLTRVKPHGDPADVLAAALGLRETDGEEALDGAVAFLHGSSALVVFDNCEHVLDGAAACMQRILDAVPGVRILATSREPICLDAEHVWQVPPMGTPQEGDEPGAAPAACDAVSLFVERSVAVRQEFVLTADNAAAVARICRRLDGLPLALELAAAQSAALSPEQIADALDESLMTLTRGSRGGAGRHRTIRASIAWSHGLLDPVEAAVFPRLSVFAGSFSMEAAQAVCAGGTIRGPDVLAAVVALVHKSLVVVDSTTAEHRYRMLETVRQYAAEQLARSGESATFRTRHLRRAVEFVEREPDPDMASGGSEWWFAQLDLERANMRAALDWAVSQGLTDERLRLGAGLGLYFGARGRFVEGRRFLGDALAGLPADPSVPMARALWAAAYLAFVSLNAMEAVRLGPQALRMAEHLGDQRTVARSLCTLGSLQINRSPQTAREFVTQAIEAARQCQDDWVLTTAQGHMALAWATHSRFEPARRYVEGLESVFTRIDAPRLRAWHNLTRGIIALRAGDLDAASREADASREAALRIADPMALARYTLLTAEIAVWQGRPRRAYEEIMLLDVVGKLSERAPILEMHVSAARAKCAVGLGRANDAVTWLEPAIDFMHRIGQRALEADMLSDLAAAEVLRGNHARARALLNRVDENAAELDDRRLLAVTGTRRAWLTLADGDVGSALELAFAALESLSADGHRLEAAHALACVAAAFAARGEHVRAARLAGAADARRRRLGMRRTPLVRLHEDLPRHDTAQALGWDELRRAVRAGAALSDEEGAAYAARGRGTRARPTRGWESLTTTEVAVARLVADGLTNPAIAERLLMSRATVKAHLARIFVKLDISRRAELGAIAARHPAPAPERDA